MLNAFCSSREVFWNFFFFLSSSEHNSVHDSILCLRQNVKRVREWHQYNISFFWRMIRLDWQSASPVARCALIGIESCLLGVDNNSWTGSQPMRNKAKMIAMSILGDKWGCWRRHFDPTRTLLLVPNNVSSVLLNNLPSEFISARLLCEKIFLNSKREEQTMNV